MGEKLFLFSENSLENPPHTHLLKHKILTLGCACTRAKRTVTQRHMCQHRDSAAWLTLRWLQNDIVVVGRVWEEAGLGGGLSDPPPCTHLLCRQAPEEPWVSVWVDGSSILPRCQR